MADSVLAWFDCGHQQMKSIRICSDHLILLSLFKQISSLIRRADKFLKLLLALNKPRPNITFMVTFTQRLTKTKVTQFSILKWLIKYLIYLEQTVFHLVTSTGQESVTLHQAADNNAVTKANCISIFKKICSALDHVHCKGYLHNDIKEIGRASCRERG